MLILTRKINESIIFDGTIKMTLIGIGAGKINVKIEAPKIYQRIERHIGQGIQLTDDIHVTVMGVTGCQTRFGIDAPREIDVHREEIFNRIQAEKEGAE